MPLTLAERWNTRAEKYRRGVEKVYRQKLKLLRLGVDQYAGGSFVVAFAFVSCDTSLIVGWKVLVGLLTTTTQWLEMCTISWVMLREEGVERGRGRGPMTSLTRKRKMLGKADKEFPPPPIPLSRLQYNRSLQSSRSLRESNKREKGCERESLLKDSTL